MGKTSTIRARIEPDLKNKAEHIFRQLGLTTTQAITLFYKQVELRKGLPFDVAIPDEMKNLLPTPEQITKTLSEI